MESALENKKETKKYMRRRNAERKKERKRDEICRNTIKSMEILPYISMAWEYGGTHYFLTEFKEIKYKGRTSSEGQREKIERMCGRRMIVGYA